MTREHKLALIVGFALVLVVGVLLSDHFSKARTAQVVSEMEVPREGQMGAGIDGLAPMPEPRDTDVVAVDPPTVTPLDPLPPRRAAPAAPPVSEFVMGEVGGPERGAPDALASLPADVRERFEIVPETGNLSAARLAAVQSTREGFGGPGAIDPRSVSATDESPAFARVEPLTVPQPAPAPELPLRRYDVREGESIYRIAQENYGDGTLWPKLREFNRDKVSASGSMKHGVTLMLPPREAITGKPSPAAAPVTNPAPKASEKRRTAPADPTASPKPERTIAKAERAYSVYTVKRGDLLSDVARSTLGTSKRWPELAELNKDVLEDPDTLTAGMKLKIPQR